jgi:hypothetical protein
MVTGGFTGTLGSAGILKKVENEGDHWELLLRLC